MLTLLSGLVAGAAHVVTGPDHLAALAPIATESPRDGARLGFRWGLGHGCSVALLGALGMGFRSAFDIEAISQWAEVSVGFLLIVIGGWAFLRAKRIVVHAHPHAHSHSHGHEEADHSHVHIHASVDDHDLPEAHRGHSHAAFFVGALHGAAGTSHLLGLLPALALPAPQATVYLVAYVGAAILAMTAFGGLLGTLILRRGSTLLRPAMFASSASALLVGVYWVTSTWPG
ncbi:MAG: hydantoin utilization protein A [Myxococcota bacterium]|nr:hydantoin utilization protein A [Myxococcota bacterium]